MTTRSTLTLETLDGRFVPSGTPATPPETPVQYGDPTPGDDYGDAIVNPQVQLQFSGVTTGMSYTLTFRVNFTDGTVGENINIEISSTATATQIAAAVASHLNGMTVNGSACLEATTDGTELIVKGKNGMKMSDVFVRSNKVNWSPPVELTKTSGLNVDIK